MYSRKGITTRTTNPSQSGSAVSKGMNSCRDDSVGTVATRSDVQRRVSGVVVVVAFMTTGIILSARATVVDLKTQTTMPLESSSLFATATMILYVVLC